MINESEKINIVRQILKMADTRFSRATHLIIP